MGSLSWLHQDTAKSLHLNQAGRAHGRGREPWGPAPPICKRGLRAVGPQRAAPQTQGEKLLCARGLVQTLALLASSRPWLLLGLPPWFLTWTPSSVQPVLFNVPQDILRSSL